MKNERKIENIIESKLNLNNEDYDIFFQGQTNNKELNEKLKLIPGKPIEQSLDEITKNNAKNYGKPDFIITNKFDNKLIIIIEAKASSKYQSTKKLNKPKKYAMDGALYYAKYLKKYFDILAIGVSGDCNSENLITDTYYWKKNSNEYQNWNDKFQDLKQVEEYFRSFKNLKLYKDIPREKIRKIAIDFHNYLRELGFPEQEKPLFISNLLLCLTNKNFNNNFEKIRDFDSHKGLLKNALNEVLEKEQIKQKKLFLNQLSKDLTNKKLERETNNGNGINYFLKELNLNILNLKEINEAYDVMGEFYHEFIKYSGGDGKGLGIVLTPYHIAEFFIELLDSKKLLSVNDKIIDIAAGTGSFLVAGMKKLFDKSNGDEEIKQKIRNQIIGIEINPQMQLMTISNMIFNHDGKSNIFQDDSLNLDNNSEAFNKIKEIKPNIGLMNPPYSQGENETELFFTLKLLNYLEPNGYAVTILPLSTAIGTKFKKERKELFKKHSLLAVITMPKDLFYPTASVNTCIMIWKAKVPHEENKQKTWLGILNDDGFIKDKKLGRLDIKNDWKKIKKEFLIMWANSEQKEDVSIKRFLKWDEEWLAEAYVKTNYKNLKQENFIQSIKNFTAFSIKYGDVNE